RNRVGACADCVSRPASGGVCCRVRGDLVEALRELFLSALHKQIPPFSRILIETTGLADPAAVMHTLKHEGFLRDRYVYAGCVTVIEYVNRSRQLADFRQALRQAGEADAIVFSKCYLAYPDATYVLGNTVATINGQARTFDAQSLPALETLLSAATVSETVGRPALLSRGTATGSFASRPFAHAAIQVITVPIEQPVSHAAFSRAMGRVHELPDVDLLRLKGLLHFQGEDQLAAVHGVHRQLYPVEQLAASADNQSSEAQPVLVFIVAGN